MANENIKYKDSVFTDLFYSDETAAKNLLELYNALYETNFTDVGDVEKYRLDDVIFMNFKNDVAALINVRRLFLGEQQSTINDNMPIRFLIYVAREYERYVDKRVMYRRSVQPIPTPEFIVFYNGAAPFPKEKVLKLSDAFMEKTNEPELELVVRVININVNAGSQLLKKCEILNEYSQFVETARKCRKENPGTGLEDAVNECIRKGILEEYLKRKGSEVVNMLTAEYNYQEDIEEKQKEAFDRGETSMFERLLAAKRLLKAGKSLADTARETGISAMRLKELLN